MENQFFVDSEHLSPEALAKKHRLETDPSSRKNHMEYLPGMEQIQSDVCENVMAQMQSYDYSKYTARDVKAALEHDTCTVEDFKALLREGADKISINSSAINTPQLISDAADKFGSQCVVVAIDAKKRADGSGWNVYKNGGRIDTGLDAVEWAAKAVRMGAGEILLTSMDCDGMKTGYDIALTRQVSEAVSVPVIASGGAGTKEHFYQALTDGKADAALAASLFHYKKLEIADLKRYLKERGISVRIN